MATCGATWRPSSDHEPVTCVREPGHLQPHRGRHGEEWISSPAFAEFDQWVAVQEISDEDVPAAFAQWLSRRTGWDGPVERVEDDESGPSS